MPCPRCEAEHELIACPYVKAMEYGPGHFRVEFLTPRDLPDTPKQEKKVDNVAADGDDYPRKGSV